MTTSGPCEDGALTAPGEFDTSQFVLKDLLIVIVLFKTRPEESTAYSSIRTALKSVTSPPEVFIYDNSPQPASVEDTEDAYYCHDPLNPGVSKAYNTAFAYATGRQKHWMLLLDQDTSVPPAYFSEVTKEVLNNPECVVFVPRLTDSRGVVSPFHFSAGRGRRISIQSSCLPLRKYRFANSGLLIKTSAFAAAGGYNERIPLDFSDISFGDQLKKITDHFRVIDFEFKHGFSGSENVSVSDALRRFEYFCTGAYIMGKSSGFPNYYMVHAFIRACRLSFRHKDFRFVTEYLKHRAHG